MHAWAKKHVCKRKTHNYAPGHSQPPKFGVFQSVWKSHPTSPKWRKWNLAEAVKLDSHERNACMSARHFLEGGSIGWWGWKLIGRSGGPKQLLKLIMRGTWYCYYVYYTYTIIYTSNLFTKCCFIRLNSVRISSLYWWPGRLVSSGSPSQFHSWHHGHMPVFKETFKNQFWSFVKTSHTVDGSEIRLTSWYGKYLHYLQGFIHVRWLALGFLNHQ